MENSEQEAAKELATFDRKVHKACLEMVEAAKRELRDLDVPFFCKNLGGKEEGTETREAMRSKMVAFLEEYISGDENT